MTGIVRLAAPVELVAAQSLTAGTEYLVECTGEGPVELYETDAALTPDEARAAAAGRAHRLFAGLPGRPADVRAITPRTGAAIWAMPLNPDRPSWVALTEAA